MRSALYKRYIVAWVKNNGSRRLSCNVVVSDMLPCRVALLVAVVVVVSVSAFHTVGHTKDHQKTVGLQTTSL